MVVVLDFFKKMSSLYFHIGEVLCLVAFGFFVRALYWVYSLLYNLKSLKFFNLLAFGLIDFRLKIILSVGAPDCKGNNYCIAIKEVKIKGSSDSDRNINGGP